MPRWPKRKLRPDVDEYGRTKLWYHALHGDLAAARDAVDSGADVNAGDDVNYTPLHAAVQEGCLPVIDFLLEAGADPNAVDSHGNGPLWVAVLSAPKDLRVEIITRLLHAGALPYLQNRHGKCPYDLAMEMRHGLEVPFTGSTGGAT